MDFFKSVLSNDPKTENLDDYGKSNTETERAEEKHRNLTSSSLGEFGGGGGGLWSFGDIVKTVTTRSESILETYRRDLKEFGSGLSKESNLFREIASRAVKDLATSIEVGASVTDGVLAADIQKDALLEQNLSDSGILTSRGYSRFDSQINVIQSDARTYCEDPEDLDDYNKWKLGFQLSDKESEIERVIGDNGSAEAIYRKVVPNEVDDETFWCRYFYRIHKLKQQEHVRANLVRKSLNIYDEEELSWDVDEEEEEADLPEIEMKQSSNHESRTVSSNVGDNDIKKNTDASSFNKNFTEEPKTSGDMSDWKVESLPEFGDCSENAAKNAAAEDLEKNSSAADVDKNKGEEPKPSGGDVSDEKNEFVPKTYENDVVAVSTQAYLQEEDLEWDEIGDIGDDDVKEVSQVDAARKDEVFKQLNTAEDDEDLSWDIEDDDEPIKASNNSK